MKRWVKRTHKPILNKWGGTKTHSCFLHILWSRSRWDAMWHLFNETFFCCNQFIKTSPCSSTNRGVHHRSTVKRCHFFPSVTKYDWKHRFSCHDPGTCSSSNSSNNSLFTRQFNLSEYSVFSNLLTVQCWNLQISFWKDCTFCEDLIRLNHTFLVDFFWIFCWSLNDFLWGFVCWVGSPRLFNYREIFIWVCQSSNSNKNILRKESLFHQSRLLLG